MVSLSNVWVAGTCLEDFGHLVNVVNTMTKILDGLTDALNESGSLIPLDQLTLGGGFH